MQRILIFVLLFIGLAAASYTDLRRRDIFIPVCIGEIPVLFFLNYSLGKGGISLWIASLGVCAFFYLVSVATREQIGKGDAFLFGMTGAGMGLFGNLLLIYITFLLTFFAAVFLLIFRRVDKKYKLPMAPFALCSYCIIGIAGGLL